MRSKDSHRNGDGGPLTTLACDPSTVIDVDEPAFDACPPEDVVVEPSNTSTGLDEPQNADDAPHISSEMSDISTPNLAMSLDSGILVPAKGNLQSVQDTYDFQPEMLEHLLQAIEADTTSTVPVNTAPDTAEVMDLLLDREPTATTTATITEAANADGNLASAASATHSAYIKDDLAEPMQCDLDGGLNERVEQARILNQDEDANSDEDFDAAAFIQGSLSHMDAPHERAGQRTDGAGKLTLSTTDSWMQGYQPEEDEEADKQATERYVVRQLLAGPS